MIEFHKVTWYSKLAAVILFVGIIPAWTFYLGMKYEETKVEILNDKIAEYALRHEYLDQIVAYKNKVQEAVFGTTTSSKVVSISKPTSVVKPAALPNCPSGMSSAFLNNKITPTITLSCKQTDQFLYKGKLAKIFDVMYDSVLDYDYYRPVSMKVTVLPSGDISFDKRYLDLRNNISANATKYVLQKFNSPPIISGFLKLKEEINGPDSDGKYCEVFDLDIPFIGVIITCTTLDGVALSTGTASWNQTVPRVETLFDTASALASSTFYWEWNESTYGNSVELHKYILQSLTYDFSGNFWVVLVKNGYINSSRFIKVDATGQASCMRSYGGLGSVCP